MGGQDLKGYLKGTLKVPLKGTFERRGRAQPREETRRGGHRGQRHGKARHYFNVFALKLDVRSCPGLLPGIRRTGIDLEVGVIHE